MHNPITVKKFHHSGFTVTVGGKTLAFDFGNVSLPDEALTLRDAAAVFVSHLHGDHLWPAHLGGLAAPIYAPADAGLKLRAEAIASRSIGIGETVEIDDMETRVTAVLADHGPYIRTPCANLGFVVEHGKRRIYYTGDVGAFTPPPPAGFDLLIMPVGGAPERGLVFNPIDAADYLRQIAYHGAVVPCHFHGLSDPHTADRFANAASGLARVTILDVGQSFVVEA